METSVKHLFYKSLYEHIQDAVFLTKSNGKISKANKKACEMLLMSEEEIVEKNQEYIVDNKDPRSKEGFRKREKNGDAQTYLNFKRKNGDIFTAQVNFSSFCDENKDLWNIVIAKDISKENQTIIELIKDTELLKSYAYYDYLTGALNRRGFIKKVLETLSHLEEVTRSYSILMLDIDNFKRINDKYGHVKGDEILKLFTNKLNIILPPDNIMGRYGGDEFIIFVPFLSCDDSLKLAEEIRKNISLIISVHKDEKIELTASIGLVSYVSHCNKTLEELILLADDFMYKAKDNKNCVYK